MSKVGGPEKEGHGPHRKGNYAAELKRTEDGRTLRRSVHFIRGHADCSEAGVGRVTGGGGMRGKPWLGEKMRHTDPATLNVSLRLRRQHREGFCCASAGAEVVSFFSTAAHTCGPERICLL